MDLWKPSKFNLTLMHGRAEMYAQKIRGVGSMLPNCVGFIA